MFIYWCVLEQLDVCVFGLFFLITVLFDNGHLIVIVVAPITVVGSVVDFMFASSFFPPNLIVWSFCSFRIRVVVRV